MALLSAVLRFAAVYSSSASDGPRDPVHPSRKQRAGTGTPGMVGAIDGGAGGLLNSGVLQLCPHGLPNMCSGHGGLIITAPLVPMDPGHLCWLFSWESVFPMPGPHGITGLAILLYVPRLPLMFALLLGIYVLLRRDPTSVQFAQDWTRYAWIATMAASAVITMLSTFHRERAVREDYAYRLPLQNQGLLNADPRSAGDGVRYVALTLDGYRLISEGQGVESAEPPIGSLEDVLSYSSGFGQVWVERSHGLLDLKLWTYAIRCTR